MGQSSHEPSREPSREPSDETRRSLWPYGIMAGLGFVVMVQVVFLVVAQRNAPVLESQTAYADSLAYDGVMQDRAASAALGWRATVEVEAGAVRYVIVDGRGQPVGGLSGAVRMLRSDTTAADAEVAVVEGPPGVYTARRTCPGRCPGGVFRLAARLEGGPSPWVDERRAVLP